MKRLFSLIAALLVMTCLVSCVDTNNTPDAPDITYTEASTREDISDVPDTSDEPEVSDEPKVSDEYNSFSLSDVPEYNGSPYAEINGNIPFFSESEKASAGVSFEFYSPKDSLGRCGVALSSVGIDIMPTEERGSIGSVKPTGWQTVKYDFVDGKYLYNRCHLIGYQLSGENANENNLITGTRYMNTQGMLPFENEVATYVERTSKHVLLRVTPVYEGENLLAKGVLMEGFSVEDDGKGVCFNVFCYNVQPGVVIDYATGESYAEKVEEVIKEEVKEEVKEETVQYTYIGNKNSKKFHYDSCSGVKSMKESNRVLLECTRDEAMGMGYSPCGICKP